MLRSPAQVEGTPVHDQQHHRRAGLDDGLQQLELASRQLQRRPRGRLADHVLPLAGHHDGNVGIPARSTARWNSASSSNPSGSSGLLPPNMSNSDGNKRCTTGRRARAPRAPRPDLGADAFQDRHGLVQVEVEDPRPDGVALGVGQRTDDRDRAQAPSVQWQQAALVAQQHRRPLGGDPGHLAVRGIGEHLAGTILVDVRSSNRPIRSFASSTRRTLASSDSTLAAPASTASGRCAYAGSTIAISRSMPALTARAPASVRSAANPWVTQVAHGVRVADHEPLEPPGPAQHLGEQPAVAGRRDTVEVHVGRHHVAGTCLDRRLERREVHVPELGVGQVDLVVVTPTEGGAVPGEVLRTGDDALRCTERPPWKPRTCAAATAAPRYGSSPAPSMIRPQRGSRAMSTIGAKVQWMPTARASRAATDWPRSIVSGSHDAAIAIGTGKIVRSPWITSKPNSIGIRGDFPRSRAAGGDWSLQGR